MDNTTNNQNNDLDFLQNKPANTVVIKDILYLVLNNLHWLILCATVGGLLATYYAKKQTKIYASSSQVLIRTNNALRQESANNIVFSNGAFQNSSINNELMILTSKTTMDKVVKQLMKKSDVIDVFRA